MALTAAEKQRRYREKVNKDENKRAQYLQKARERWQKNKIAGKTKTVEDMSERELRSKRRYWKDAKRKSRLKQKQIATVMMTPPGSPEMLDQAQPGPSR